MLDCHFHVRATHSHTPEQRARYVEFLRREANALGIEKFYGIMESGGSLQEPRNLAETRKRNRLLGKYVAEYPNLFEGWARAHPAWGDAAVQEFRRAVREDGLIGYKLWTEYNVDGPQMEPIAEAAVELDVPVLVHTLYRHEPREHLPHETAPTDLRRFAQRFPNLDIIEAHISTDDAERRVKLTQDLDNVYLDISGSSCASGMIEFAVDRVGAERVVFGTDLTPIPAVGRLLDADITDAERETIAYNIASIA